MTPWNRARDRTGQLWVWDWESSEEDAVAGLDPLHWAFRSRALAMHDPGEVRLAACVEDAAPFLVAAGCARSEWSTVAATYAIAVVERACVLADRSGWTDAYLGQEGLATLVQQAEGLLGS
jgi:hypothetical protein